MTADSETVLLMNAGKSTPDTCIDDIMLMSLSMSFVLFKERIFGVMYGNPLFAVHQVRYQILYQ